MFNESLMWFSEPRERQIIFIFQPTLLVERLDMNWKDIILSEIGQIQKNKYYITKLSGKNLKYQPPLIEAEKNSGFQKLEGGENKEILVKGY